MTKHESEATEGGRDILRFSGLVPLGLGRPPPIKGEGFDSFDRVVSDLKHLYKRRNDRFALNDANLVEKYLSGHFSVLLYFKAHTCRGVYKTSQAPRTERQANFFGMKHDAIVVSYDNISNHSWNDDWCNQSMLVGGVQLAQRPQEQVPSLIRAYLVQEKFRYALDCEAYVGVPAFAFGFPPHRSGVTDERVLEFFPLLSHWESYSLVSPLQEGARGIIESTPHVVQGVAKSEQQFGRQRVLLNDSEGLAVSIILHPDLAEVSVGKGIPDGFKFCGAFVGPSQLEVGL